jgi:hypothetical protein
MKRLRWPARTGRQKSLREANPLSLAVFGIPFLGVGVGVAVACAMALMQANAMRNWQEVPATIVEAGLESSSDSDGGTTYRVTASYRYEWNGRVHKGNRVGIHSGLDNIGSWQIDTHNRLESCRAAGKDVPCYVNPANPAESILFRGVRWEKLAFQGIFALVFGSAGAGMIAGGVVLRRKRKSSKALREAHPGEPWMWNPEWAGGEIKSSNRTAAVVMVVVAVCWNLIAVPGGVIGVVDGYMRDHNEVALLSLLFPAAGFVLACFAAVQWARWRRFGESVFKMEPFPGLVGGRVAGVVHVPVHLRPESGFIVALECRRTYDCGDSTSTETLWEAERKISRELFERDLKRSAIPIFFNVPYACRPTDEAERITWHLRVSARTDRGRYQSKFDIPVFRTADSSPDGAADESAISAFEDKGLFREQCGENRITVKDFPDGGAEYVFPTHPGQSLMGIGVCAVGFIIGVSAASLGATALFSAGICAVGAALGGAMAVFWLRSSRVTVRRGAVNIRRSIAGIPIERTIPVSSVVSLDVKYYTQSGTTWYYAIAIHTADARKHTAACTLTGRAFVDQLAEHMRQAIDRER